MIQLGILGSTKGTDLKAIHEAINQKVLNAKISVIISNRPNAYILKRAEILAKNLKFTGKANIYSRLTRLIDEKLMGDLFKVAFISKKKDKFNIGFK